jgi:hypothetical protein
MKMSEDNGKYRIQKDYMSIRMRILGRPLKRWFENVPDRRRMMMTRRRRRR